MDGMQETPQKKITVFKFIRTLVNNLIVHAEEKYRVIKLQNEVVLSKVGHYQSFKPLLESIGFVIQDDGGLAILSSNNEDLELLRRTEQLLTSKISSKFASVKLAQKPMESKEEIEIDTFVDTEFHIFRENVASASLPHPNQFVPNESADVALLQSVAGRAAQKAKLVSSLVSKQYVKEKLGHSTLQVERVRIRFRFADKICVQGSFGPHVTITRVFSYLRDLLLDRSLPFLLKVPVQGVLREDDSRSLLQAGLSPATGFFVCEASSLTVYTGESVLTEAVLSRLEDNPDEARYSAEAAAPVAEVSSENKKKALKSFIKL